MHLNPIALRTGKTLWSFVYSELNKKILELKSWGVLVVLSAIGLNKKILELKSQGVLVVLSAIGLKKKIIELKYTLSLFISSFDKVLHC